jgi:hypothetical protein
MVWTVRFNLENLTSFSKRANVIGAIIPAMIFIIAMKTVLYRTRQIFGIDIKNLKLDKPMKSDLKKPKNGL